MVAGIGIDIIETQRIREKLQNLAVRDFIFSPYEISYCETKRNKAEHYAARFAAKEAFMKALGTGWTSGARFREIEVHSEDNGRPYISLSGETKTLFDNRNIARMHLTISHLKDTAVAVVVLEM